MSRKIGYGLVLAAMLSACSDRVPPSAPTTPNASLQKASGALAFVVLQDGIASFRTNDASWPNDIIPSATIQEGHFTSTGYPARGGIISGNFAGSQTQWLGDTLFGTRLDYWRYGSTIPGCEFSAQSTATGTFSTMNGSCSSTFLEVNYWFVKMLVETAFTAEVQGPTYLTERGPFTWNVIASGAGGSGTYSYSWSKSTNGGASWATVCGGAPSCSLTVDADPAQFLVRATVISYVHAMPDQHSAYIHSHQVSTNATLQVNVALSPLSLYIYGGYNPVAPGQNCPWYSQVTSGQGPYTYQWSGLSTSDATSSSVTGALWSSGYIQVAVTDSHGRHGTAWTYVDVDPSGAACAQ